MVFSLVNPDIINSFEHSNECWNFGFPQAGYFNAIAGATWPGEGSGWIEAAGARASEVMTIVKARAAAVGATARCKCVMNVQTGWVDTGTLFPWLASRQLTCPLPVDDGHAICTTGIDRVALTFYVSAGLQYQPNWPLIQSWIADYGLEGSYTRGMNQLRFGNIPGLRNRDNTEDITVSNASSFVNICAQVESHVEYAASLGLEAVYYEWDTHFDDTAGSDHTAWLVGLCRHSLMKTLFKDILTFSSEVGIKIANVWGSTEGNTQWAIAANMADTTHAKYSALAEWRLEHPLE
jgi:hypothetical protein